MKGNSFFVQIFGEKNFLKCESCCCNKSERVWVDACVKEIHVSQQDVSRNTNTRSRNVSWKPHN